MTPEEIKKFLLESIAIVTFRKVEDGKIRRITCTLSKDFVNEDDRRKAIAREEVLPVWEVELKQWRSFRFDKMISMEGVVKDD